MEETDDPMLNLANMARRYYAALRELGIPEALAVRLTGDWHQAVFEFAVKDFLTRGMPTTKRANMITERAIKSVTEPDD